MDSSGVGLRGDDRVVRLPPGPATPPREAAAHQRARLRRAMVELAAENDVAALTVASIISRAHVSKRTLYEHFSGKDDCFLRTYDDVVGEFVGTATAAQAGSRDWLQGLRLALAALAERIAQEPEVARLLLLGPLTAGEAARARSRELVKMCEARIAYRLATAPGCVAPSRPLTQGIVAGLVRVVRSRVLGGREGELIGASEELARWAVSVGCLKALQVRRLGRLQTLAAHRPPLPADLERRQRPIGAADEPRATPPRELILDAAARLAGRDGAVALTHARIRKEACLTPREFREHFEFEDMSACFMASVGHVMDRALRRALRAGAQGGDWPGGVYRALCSICNSAAADGSFAKIVFVEVLANGADGICAREEIVTALAERLRAVAPAELRPDPLAAEASIAAAWRTIHERVASGRTRGLAEIAPLLSWFVLAPALGEERSIEAISAEQERIQRASVDRERTR